MGTIHNEESLREAITLLEAKHAAQEAALKAELKRAYESMRPINLIKSTVEEFTTPGDIRSDLIDTSVSIAAGYMSRRLLDHASASDEPATAAVGNTLLSGAAEMVRRNPEMVRTIGAVAFQLMRSGMKQRQPDIESSGKV